jgi:hypothetical protein
MSPAPTKHDLDERPEILFQNAMPVGHDLTRSLRLSFLIIKRRKHKYLHYKTRYLSAVYPHLFATCIFTNNKMKVFMQATLGRQALTSSLGATGFIAGDLLYLLNKTHPEYDITCLVRTQENADKVKSKYPDVRCALGSNDSDEVIQSEVEKADLIIRVSEFCLTVLTVQTPLSQPTISPASPQSALH